VDELFLKDRHCRILRRIAEAEANGKNILSKDFWNISSSQARSIGSLRNDGLIVRIVKNGKSTLRLTEKGRDVLKSDSNVI